MGVNPEGFGITTPRFWAGGHRGGCEQVSENTIGGLAYFGQKIDWKVICFKKKEKNVPRT